MPRGEKFPDLIGQTRADFNRCHPLLERKCVPCEKIRYTSKHQTRGVKNEKPLSKTASFYTLRILQGHKSKTTAEGILNERAVRLELSNEYTKIHSAPPSLSSIPLHDAQNGGIFSPGSTKNVASDQSSLCKSLLTPPLHSSGNINDKRFVSSGGPFYMPEPLPPASKIVDSEPIHLYEMEVGESDFADLQQDQALHIDFSNFANSLIDLLMLCDLGNSTNTSNDPDILPANYENSRPDCSSNPLMGCQLNAKSGIIGEDYCINQSIPRQESQSIPHIPTSRYFCRIEEFPENISMSRPTNTNYDTRRTISDVRFSVVESNQFRELTHISLNVQVGTDTSICNYLSTRLAQTLGQNSILSFQLKKEKEHIETTKKACSDISKQYNQLARTSETEKSILAHEADETIQKENAKRTAETKSLIQDKNQRLQSIKIETEKIQQGFKKEIQELKQKNAKVIEDKKTIEDEIIEIKKIFSDRSAKLSKVENDLLLTRSNYEEANISKEKAEKSLQLTNDRVSHLEKTCEQRKQDLLVSEAKTQAFEQSILDTGINMEAQISQLNDSQTTLTSIKEEKSKLKNLLARYQSERQEMKKVMKSKIDMIQRQEEILRAKEIESGEMQQILDQANRKVKDISNAREIDTLRLAEANGKVTENMKTLESNQQVRFCLNSDFSLVILMFECT